MEDIKLTEEEWEDKLYMETHEEQFGTIPTQIQYGGLELLGNILREDKNKNMKQAKKFIGYEKVKTSLIGIFIIVSLAVIGSVWIGNTEKSIIYQVDELNLKNPSNNQSKSILGTITAYNVGDINQNWGNPCISAYNIDVCQLVEQGINIVANNCLEQGTEIEIYGYGRFVVLDKMNSRFDCSYFDIAMSKDKVIEAIKFGKLKNVNVKIYN